MDTVLRPRSYRSIANPPLIARFKATPALQKAAYFAIRFAELLRLVWRLDACSERPFSAPYR
jgi:hypothetical protein